MSPLIVEDLRSPTERLLDEVQFSKNRDEVVTEYADCLLYYLDDVDWGMVNRAIMARWSLAALKYIKTKAWKERDAFVRSAEAARG